MTYRSGARATRGITVLVTDETGKPVEGAVVSFQLPDQGPSGVFNSGRRTETVTSGADGRATVWGMQWNKSAGAVEIRITAVKDQARAGIVATQYLNDTVVAQTGVPQAGGEGVFQASHKGHGKWLLIGAVAGGAAAAGIVFARSASKANPATPPVGISIGSPSIIVGHP